MTPEQYARWKDFSLRMARNAFPDATEARRQKIESKITGFFSWYDDDPETVAKIVDWDNSPTYICDAMSDYLSDHYHEREMRNGRLEPRGNKFESQVSCCIRAGLDCASQPSAGVLGFTVGDLRRMYPEGIPDWAVEGFDPPITHLTPDAAGVWL